MAVFLARMHKGARSGPGVSSPRASPVAALKKGVKSLRSAMLEWSSALSPE
jgi:hypothetical protein